jgi:hypothetical protein
MGIFSIVKMDKTLQNFAFPYGVVEVNEVIAQKTKRGSLDKTNYKIDVWGTQYLIHLTISIGSFSSLHPHMRER